MNRTVINLCWFLLGFSIGYAAAIYNLIIDAELVAKQLGYV